LLAYVGDQLSYQQDAIATEAYLNSARKRVSLQRHARLVDYFVHNGTNARVWVQLTSEADLVNVPARTQILSRLERTNIRIPPGSTALDEALRQHPLVFETLHPITLFGAHIGNAACQKARPLRRSKGISRICRTMPCSSLKNNADRSPAKRKTLIVRGAGLCA
jgi:hypothetical protein